MVLPENNDSNKHTLDWPKNLLAGLNELQEFSN